VKVPASELAAIRLVRWLALDAPDGLPPITCAAPDAQRQWTDAIAIGLASGLLPAIFHRHLPGQADEKPATPADHEVRRWSTSFRYRHASQTTHLAEVVASLNQSGMVPLLVGHARTLWLDERPDAIGRHLRVLVAPGDLPNAAGVMSRLGYRNSSTFGEKARGTSAWFRPDLHGWMALAASDRAWPAGPMSKHARGSVVAQVLSAGDDAMLELVVGLRRRLIARPVAPLEVLYHFARASDASHAFASAIRKQKIIAASRNAARRIFGRRSAEPDDFVNASPLASLDAYTVALGERRFGVSWRA
jgi:hypothetical protein